MGFNKITLNKTLFVLILLVELVYTYLYFSVNLFYHIDILLFILILASKYYLYLICYKTINRRNINYGILSLGLSFLYEIILYSMLFIRSFMIFSILSFTLMPVSIAIKLILLLSIYFFKTLLYFDINIPVEGYEVGKRVDAMAESIPGL